MGVSLLTLCLAIGALPLSAISALAVSPDVVISEYRTRGPLGGNDEFIELQNISSVPVNIGGWKIKGSNNTGGGTTTPRSTVPVGLILAAGCNYLLVNVGSNGYSGAVSGDQTYTTGITDDGGIAVTTSGDVIVDQVGMHVGSAFKEGTVLASFGGTNGDRSYQRRTGATPGTVQDTDNNANDFAMVSPSAPRNRALCGEVGPSVTATSPANGAGGIERDANIVVTFSESVTVTGTWFDIACTVSGAHTAAQAGAATGYTLDPTSDFAGSETCSVTVFASQVSDTDPLDPPDNLAANYAFSFTTVAPPTLIREIQGTSHISPKVNTSVSSVPGVVTARRSNGFWMQDTAPDADVATSEGIFVFTNSSPSPSIQPGITVKVSGTVAEFRPGGGNNLTITEIIAPSVTITGVAALPAPTIIGAAGRQPPVTVIENDSAGNIETSNTFDPAQDGIDFYESLEGMLVGVSAPVAVSRTTRFSGSGEIWVVGDGGAAATTRSTRGAIVISPGDFNPERILVDDELFKFTGPMPDVNVGATFAAATLTGLMDYAFSNYRIQLLAAPIVASDTLTREVTEPATKNELSAATFNVENLDANDPQSKFDELAGLIVTNLASPDILALEEIQDDNGPINDGTVRAGATIARLVAAITALGGPTYDWRSVDPENNTDGGEPGGNIRVGFLFRTDGKVEFIDRPGATATTANAVIGQRSSTRLAYSPGRVVPTDQAWNSSRKPLAAEFRFRGEQLFIIANHFNSKGGDQSLVGRAQPPTLGSEVQRLEQARVLHAFVAEILAADPKANVVVLGDINDFQFSAPMSALKGDLLHALIDTLPASERYSYVFDGNGQALDHILVSAALFSQPFKYDIVHVNAEFASRASDHDPQVVRLGIKGNAKKD